MEIRTPGTFIKSQRLLIKSSECAEIVFPMLFFSQNRNEYKFAVKTDIKVNTTKLQNLNILKNHLSKWTILYYIEFYGAK